jgi:glycosyltransferase involved in cell wall biosynthesis
VTPIRQRFGFPIVYDCHDYLAGFERLSPEVISAEPFLIEQSDRILFSSCPLMEMMTAAFPAAHTKATLMRNACFPEHFISRDSFPSRQPNVTVGYVGSLDHWFDVELFAKVASTHSTFNFVLAGRVEDARLKHLACYSNIHFLGELPYSSIPALLQSCDAAIIPFIRSPLTLATNPIKLYEYFGAGLPIVSTRLPEVELHGDLVYIADDSTQFAALLAQAVREDRSLYRERRRQVARAETWHRRADALLALV